MRKTATVLLLFFSALTHAQSDLGKGLLAYYPFNGNAKDSSGNHNDPIFNNATLTTDRNGKPKNAYHFNGINNYMQIPNSKTLNPGYKLTLCAWVRVTGFYAGECHGNCILMKGDADYLPGDYFLRFHDGTYNSYQNCTLPLDTKHENFFGSDAYSEPPGYTPYISPNVWYSIVATYDGTTSKLYINCELKASKTQTQKTFINTYDLFFGKLNNEKFPYWYNGDIDEIRIYNRAFTEDEMKEYGDCKPPEMRLLFSNPLVIKNKLIKLKWNTNVETNIHDYFIERSTKKNSNKFISLGSVASNKKSTSNKYTFTDTTAKPNTLYYYRIVINDNDSKKKYSETKTAKIIDKQLLATALLNTTNIPELEVDSVRTSELFANEHYKEQHKDSFNNLPDPVIATAAAKVSERKNEIQETIYYTSDSLELTLYDNGDIDGDTVSVLMNGNIIIAKQLLSANPFVKKIAMPQDSDSIQLVMYAENLGSIPPNTGLLILRDGKDKHQIRFSGDLRKNSTIILKRR